MKNMRKKVRKLTSQFLVVLLVISMVVTLLPVQQAAATGLPVQQKVAAETFKFRDVKQTNWYYDAVDYVEKNGLFKGTGDDQFSPQGTMTRANFVVVLGRMAGVDVSEYSTSAFSDVKLDKSYAPYVAWAVENKITVGTGDGKFSPNAPINREQMALMTFRYFESYQIPYERDKPITTKPKDLAKISPSAVDAVVKLWQAGLFSGDEKGNFNPKAKATRAQAAAFFMRSHKVVQAWIIQKQEDNIKPTPKPDGNPGGNNNGSNPGGNTGGKPGGNNGGNTGGDNGGNPGGDNGGTPGGDNGGTPGGDNGGTPGGDNGGTPGGDNGGTPGGDNGGTPGGDNGGTPGGDNGGTPGGDNGGTPGGDNGGTPGGDNGGTPGGDNGGTPGGDNGGNPGGDNGGTPGGDNGGTPGGDNGGNTGGDNSGNPGGDNGGNPDGNKPTYTITFESNGGTSVKDKKVRQDEVVKSLPSPAKDGSIFQGWFMDSELSAIFADGSTVTADTKLYAKYIDSVSNAVQSIPSYTALDVNPTYTISVTDTTGTLSVADVQAGMTFKNVSNPDSADITVTGSNGQFMVSSAAESSKFVEGNTYELTLTNDDLSFAGKDATTRIYVFSVKKQEVMNIPLNPDLIYIPFSEVADMELDGQVMDTPSVPVITTTVDDSGSSNTPAKDRTGTFKYTGSTNMQAGNTVAIYQGIRPDERTVTTTGDADGDVAYVQIITVDGSNYTYKHADPNQVLFKPDVLPVSNTADTDEDPTNNSITIEHVSMNYSDEKYKEIGLSELTTVDVGDFIAFYEGEFAKEGSSVVSYGRITSITPKAEMDVITYDVVTIDDITNSFNIYQQQAIAGEDLLAPEEITMLESQIERQALDSGFVEESVDYLSTLALETDEFKLQSRGLLGESSKVEVKNLSVVAKLGNRLNNIDGKTSGVSATLEIGADIVIEIDDDSSLVIHMTGSFIEEISLDLGINGEMQGHWLTFLGAPYWYSIDDYVVTTNLDTHTYTGINITAEIATVSHDKLQAALNNWVDEKTSGRLGQVLDIADQIKAQMEDQEDTDVDIKAMKARYQEMLENDTDWATLIEITLFEESKRVLKGLIEVKFEANFVVKAKVNLTVGADFNYKTAKRYTASLYILSFRGTTDTVPLPGDGDYQFTFYVMGTLGLKAGVNMSIQAGLLSVDLNSVGLSVEPGAYVNLWGYFYYQLKNENNIESSQSLGALFVEVGIYLEVEIGAQLGDGFVEGSIPVYENMWPLYTAGMQGNVEDFAYQQDEGDFELFFTEDRTGIMLPDSLFKMKVFDLKTGEDTTQVYDPKYFDIQVSGVEFEYSPTPIGNLLRVIRNWSSPGTGMLVITWKGAPLSFTSDPIKRTIPMYFVKSEKDTLSLELNLGKHTFSERVFARLNETINVKNRVPVRAGYTFEGWYTSEGEDGKKVDIPKKMTPAVSILYARWTANTNTKYKVNHYLVNPNKGQPAILDHSEIRTGTTDEMIQINSDKYKDSGYSNGKAQVFIYGEGSAVANIYYEPIKRTAVFDLGYGADREIRVNDIIGKNIGLQIPIPKREGYKFTEWTPEVPVKMPKVDTIYTANWTVRDDMPYKVVFLKQNIDSDTYTVADVETYYGTTNTKVTLPENQLKLYEGFTFDKSNKNSELEAVLAADGTTVLRAYFKRNTYKMTIDYNDAKTPQKVKDVPYGATTLLHLGTPSWPGHQFVGWEPLPTETMGAQDVTHTAKWDTNQFTINFVNNGGAEEIPSQMLEYGVKVSEPTPPTKADYAFGGWYTDEELTSLYDFNRLVLTDLTLYAKWMRSYTMNFNSNGGSEIPDQTVYEGMKSEEPKSPTRDEYVFGGWFSDKDLTKGYDFATEIVKGNITLYAKWTVDENKEYLVRFYNWNDGYLGQQAVKKGGLAEEIEPPVKYGSTFQLWRHKQTGRTFNFTTPITQDYDLFAEFLPTKYEVSFISDGTKIYSQSVRHEGTVQVPTAPTREGYTFKGWHSDLNLTNRYDFNTLVRGELTLYAKWDPLFTVSFDSNGGSAVSNQVVEFNAKVTEPLAPEWVGYKFGGWYSDSALTSPYHFNTLVTNNITLYAKWTPLFTVGFDYNDGLGVVNPQAVSKGETVIEPTEPTKPDHKFGGWYTDEGLTIPYDFTTEVTTDLTLYVKWKELHSVQFRVRNPSNLSEVIRVEVPDGDMVSPPDTPIMVGDQRLYKWSTTPEGSPFDFSTPITSNTTIWGHWVQSAVVTFESNGGSEVATQYVTVAARVAEPEQPVKLGFGFDGWYKEPEFTTRFTFTSGRANSNMTLYAKWISGDEIAQWKPADNTVFSSFMDTFTANQMTEEAEVVAPSFTPVMDSYMSRLANR